MITQEFIKRVFITLCDKSLSNWNIILYIYAPICFFLIKNYSKPISYFLFWKLIYARLLEIRGYGCCHI